MLYATVICDLIYKLEDLKNIYGDKGAAKHRVFMSILFFRKATHQSLPLKKFFLPLRLSCKENSTFLTKPLFPQEREDVAGYTIASARVLASSAEPVP